VTSTRQGSALVVPALALAVSAISCAAILFKLAAPTHPLVAAGTRLAIAALLLSPVVVRAARSGRLGAREARAGALAGLFYAVHFGAWVSSLALTSVAASVTLVTATPLLLAVTALVTGRDRPSRRHWLALGMAIAGLGLVGAHDLALSGQALAGDALALLGCAAMAAYLWSARRLGDRLDVLAFGGVATAVGAVTLFGAAAITGVLALPCPSALGWLALAALVPQLVGHTLLTWALRHARPTVVGLATVGEPVGSTALAWWIFGERVAPLVALGCAVTLGAVVFALRGREPTDEPPPPR